MASTMRLLDHTEETSLTSPTTIPNTETSPEGRTTLIILERDGSLRHYPPPQPDGQPTRARVELSDERAEPTIIDKILDFTFDILGIGNLELRVYERQG